MATEQIRITVFDTTFRDGDTVARLQHELSGKVASGEHSLTAWRRRDRSRFLHRTSDGDFEAVKAIAAVIRRPVIADARACRRY